MKKIIFGIFAHPDDEAFGPSGTLLLEARSGAQIHLITLTNGSAGMNPDNHANLGDIRIEEWRRSGKIIGAKSMNHLGYEDGQLNNRSMIEISSRITEIVRSALSSETSDTTVEFMTLDLNGLTGHIDHIVAARTACFVFYNLKKTDARFNRIRFSCLPESLAPSINIDWIFQEPGHPASEINETVDARSYLDDILAVVEAHHSQRSDGGAYIKSRGKNLGLDYFIVRS